MSISVPAKITPEILSWARETMRLDIDTAAERLGIDPMRLSKWESGDESISIAQLRKLANVYRRPFSCFYLSTRPKEERPPHEYRRIRSAEEFQNAPQLALAIRMAVFQREGFIDLAAEEGRDLTPFQIKASQSEKPETVAARIRDALNISLETQLGWADKRIAFNAWRRALERKGTLIFLFQGVDEKEARGFSLVYPVLPVISINSQDAYAGRSFTLFHELVHLMLRKPGVCDIVEEYRRRPVDQATEVYCNAVAGAALVPRNDFDSFIRSLGNSTGDLDGLLGRISRRYSVSELMALRRLFTCEHISQTVFQTKHDELVSLYERRKESKRASQKSVPIPIATKVLSALGLKYTGQVVRSYQKGHITLSDVVDYIGVKTEHFGKIRQAYEDRLVNRGVID